MNEQSQQFIEELHRLPEQLRKWFYIAACGTEQEYQATMQTVTKENDRQFLMKIRGIFIGTQEERGA